MAVEMLNTIDAMDSAFSSPADAPPMRRGRALSVGCLQRASAISISSIMLLRFLRLMRLMASLLTMTLVQNGFIAADRFALTRPPGGLNDQHRTSAAAAALRPVMFL